MSSTRREGTTNPGGADAEPPTVDVEAEPASRRRRLRRRRGELITDAAVTHEQNLRARERRYVLLQGLRVPFILLSILAAWTFHNWWLAAVLFAVSVPLPWIAVMIGNGQGEKRDPRRRNVYKPAQAREQARRAELERQARREIADRGAGGAIIDHDEFD
ncbi:DUF3099 domain-containing protein [Corynebacterium liangguodongii]|uniref:DUF3099 domain-containing protein n=1 Tax=Corynebacterium liangguodongii TaxID=2079535 RepID=A0A2S0WEF6_9CORY|nr:DUF3099 domain-containing protein [Corynebacterium liangguodongii]AWB84151.1 DUF3099 domain-containing protein [Corynebacterium liangguodongii]PWC00162.1 DUF3099 domain-containing protein [Corynebacterium liangguodongii]